MGQLLALKDLEGRERDHAKDGIKASSDWLEAGYKAKGGLVGGAVMRWSSTAPGPAWPC